MKKQRNVVDLTVLIIIISVGFYVALIIFSDFQKILDSFEKVKFDNYPLIITLNFVIYTILAIRYHFLLGSIGINLSIKDSFLVSFSGQSMFSTFGRAGTIVKSYLIKKKHGHSISKTGPIILIEQFLDLKSSVLILAIGLIWFQVFEAQLVLIIGVILTTIFYLMMRHNGVFETLKKIFSNIKFLKRFTDNIDESKDSVRKLLSAKSLIVSTGLSFLVKILQVLVVFLIFESLGLDLEFLKSGIIYFTSMLAGAFLLLPGGVIVTDSSMLGLFLNEGIDLSTSSIAVIITRFITLWFMVIVGLISLKVTIKIFNIKQKEKKVFWDELDQKKKRSVNHPVVKFYMNQRVEYIQKRLNNFNDVKTALDVGAGYGYSSYHMPESIKITDLDFSFTNLLSNPIKEKIQGSALNLPYKDNSFDLVYGWSFLHHLDSPDKAVKEMARVSKKYLILLEPNRNNPVQFAFGLLHPEEHGTLSFTKNRLLDYVNQINFKLISCDATGWLFAGASPTFSLKLCKHLPFVHKLGTVNIMICKKE